MDSLDAQCLIMRVIEGKIDAPRIWRHDRSGALSCGYGGGKSVFTWAPEDVSRMARTSRDSSTRPSQRAQAFFDAHRRLAVLAESAGLEPPDAVIHDAGCDELRATWEDEDLVVVVVDEVGCLVHSRARFRA
jgi:hypothetical protein